MTYNVFSGTLNPTQSQKLRREPLQIQLLYWFHPLFTCH